MTDLASAASRASEEAGPSRASVERSKRTLHWLVSVGPALVAGAALIVTLLRRSRLRQELWTVELRRNRQHGSVYPETTD